MGLDGDQELFPQEQIVTDTLTVVEDGILYLGPITLMKEELDHMDMVDMMLLKVLGITSGIKTLSIHHAGITEEVLALTFQ